jgi:hypothetical protein
MPLPAPTLVEIYILGGEFQEGRNGPLGLEGLLKIRPFDRSKSTALIELASALQKTRRTPPDKEANASRETPLNDVSSTTAVILRHNRL